MDQLRAEEAMRMDEFRAEEAIIGNARAILALRKLIVGTSPSKVRGLLLHGRLGTGKASSVLAVVREADAHFILVTPDSIAEDIKVLWEAFSSIKVKQLAVIFLQEIDVMCPRGDSRHTGAVTYELLRLMNSSETTSGKNIVVVGSTTRLDAVDPELRASSLFGLEVEVTAPSEAERLQILKLHTKEVPVDPGVDLNEIAALCSGYIGADLKALCRAARDCAVKRCSKATDLDLQLLSEDWQNARATVGPGVVCRRDGQTWEDIAVSVETPKVYWDDIHVPNALKQELKKAIEWVLSSEKRDLILEFGGTPVRGILLHGPPGMTTTSLAKAAATATQATLFSVTCAQLILMASELAQGLLHDMFSRARRKSMSVIFLDELHILAPQSDPSEPAGRLLTTLLTELDALEDQPILVMAATNERDAIDAKLMRVGRFAKVLYVPPPAEVAEGGV